MKNTFGSPRTANLPIVWTKSTCLHSHDIQCLVPCLLVQAPSCRDSVLLERIEALRAVCQCSCEHARVGLLALPCHGGCYDWQLAAQTYLGPVGGLARKGKVWSLRHTGGGRQWPGVHTQLDLNGVRPRSEALSVGLQRLPTRREGRRGKGPEGILASWQRPSEEGMLTGLPTQHSSGVTAHASSHTPHGP